MNDIAVVGAGAWGTALAMVAANAGRRVVLWARNPARAAQIQADRENSRLPGIRLPDRVAVTGALNEARAPLVLLAVPLQHLGGVAADMPAGGAFMVCAKGVEASSLRLPLEILQVVWPDRAACVLTGPNFAGEVARGLPAAAVVASHDAELRGQAIAALGTARFRLYGNDDPVSAQVGGAAKNVIAIAAGAAIGAGLGENARAALITRGLAEVSRLAVALGGRASTLSGLSGLGDLLLTCTGAGSRNYGLGFLIGQGGSLADALGSRAGVAEGVATAPALVARAEAAGVAMPICRAVAEMVAGRAVLADQVAALLDRRLRDE